MVLGALSEGSGWRRIEGKSAAAKKVPFYVAPEKKSRVVQTEVASKRDIGELRTRFPQVSWR